MSRRAIGAMPRVCVVEPSKNARVRIGGRAFWLGPCPNCKVTQDQFAEAFRLWQQFGQGNQAPPQPARVSPAAATPTPSEPPPPPPADEAFTVSEIGVRYHDHCLTYYRTPDGKVTSSVAGVEMALRALFPFANAPANSFGPKSLKAVRDALVAEGRPRVTCNRVVNAIRRMFKWAASEELVPSGAWHSLQSVAALQKGRTQAPEVPPVDEVPEAVVNVTLPHLSPVVAAMIQLQRWTGARPGEVCLVRPCDVDRSGPVWVFTPEHHKLSWRESSEPRTVVIGRAGQRVLAPYLLCPQTYYCFSPRDAERQRAQARRAAESPIDTDAELPRESSVVTAPQSSRVAWRCGERADHRERA